MKKFLSLSVLALSLVTAQAPSAYACMYEKGMFLEHTVDKLQLSAEQKAKIHSLREEIKPQLEKKREQMKAIHMRVKEAFKNGSLSGMKQRALAREEKDVAGGIITIRMQERAELSKILTEEQRVKLINMMEAKRAKMEAKAEKMAKKHHKKH